MRPHNEVKLVASNFLQKNSMGLMKKKHAVYIVVEKTSVKVLILLATTKSEYPISLDGGSKCWSMGRFI